MLFSDLQDVLGGNARIKKDGKITRFCTDTRSLGATSQQVFVAIKAKRDGHLFISEAIARGVRYFLIQDGALLENRKNVNYIVVPDTIRALQKVAQNHREKFDIPIVGITGSNGKTTVKEWLSVLLSEERFVIKNPKSYNSQIGVPISILEMRDLHQVGVFEAGISQRNEMEYLKKIINPSFGIFTTLGNAHSDGFRSENEKLKEKLVLFTDCKKVICRKDTSYFDQVKKNLGEKVFSWSLMPGADHYVSWENGVITVGPWSFKTQVLHAPNLENLTHAIVAALKLGISEGAIQTALQSIRAIPMRLEMKKGINGSSILDDSYNNDLQGLRVAIDYMSTNQQYRKKTLILSDILHSGKDDELLYREINDLLLEHKIDRLIGVGPRITQQQRAFSLSAVFFPTSESLLENLPSFDSEMIMVKGARDFTLERVVKRLEQRKHGTILEVNLEAIQHNLSQYRSLLSHKTKMMVMVKANAYGSGILEVSNFLQHQRVDQLGVAYVDEAILLRKNGIHLPIMIMNPDVESFHSFEKYKLQAEIYSVSHLQHFLSSSTRKSAIHLKIDTGMHRLGFDEEEIPRLLEILSLHPELKVAGIFTHFAASEDVSHDEFTNDQAAKFERIYDQISGVLGYQPDRHACNSAGIIRWPEYHYEMVRLGIGLHAYDATGNLHLQNTTVLKSTVSQVRKVKKGGTIGYSRSGVVSRDSLVAILPIGYEDGFQRAFGNGKASVMINGSLYPTIGNVCMDMVMIDVTDPEVKEGSEVIIFGETPALKDLAKTANTIPYEILTNISSRVKRVFVWE
ncbi:MAG: bifunctional UDP-N-acetylmuramoyl-tripeptide:D-alanyl-D-alanine ligase/alanine racemase [Bacteroidota bacterium]